MPTARSSLIQSKITGNLVFLLVTPLSHWAWFAAYVGRQRGARAGGGHGRVRGHGLVRAAALCRAAGGSSSSRVLGAGMLGTLGLIAGLWADKFDQTGGVPELHHHADDLPVGRVLFGAVAAAVLAGAVSHLNPFFYMIDGFRRGFFGASDVSPWLSLAVVGASFAIVAAVALRLLASGYKLRT